MGLLEIMQHSDRVRTRNLLRKVDKSGTIGKMMGEAFFSYGWINFGPPRPEIDNPYNCYRLTPEGKEKLNELENLLERKKEGL